MPRHAAVSSPATTWAIAASATMGGIVRPFGWPEAVWALSGAGLLVALGILSTADVLQGIG